MSGLSGEMWGVWQANVEEWAAFDAFCGEGVEN